MLEYDVSDEFLRFAQYDGLESQIALPIDEKEFRRLSALSPGLELVRYRSRQRDSMTGVSAKLQFDSLGALSVLFDDAYRFSADPWQLTLPLVTGLAGLSDTQKDAIRELDATIGFHFSLSFPHELTYEFINLTPPQIGQPRPGTMEFSYALQDLLDLEGRALVELRR